MAGINLDAILGENQPRPLVYKGQTFDLPGELPAETLAPFLDEDLGLVEIIADVVAQLFSDEAEGETSEKDIWDQVFDTLKARPRLPLELIAAAKAALASLLGDRAEEFFALQPSVPAYFALAQNLTTEYGFGLTDFFGSPSSSEAGGDDSSATSSTTTDSTPEASGDAPESPASSA